MRLLEEKRKNKIASTYQKKNKDQTKVHGKQDIKEQQRQYSTQHIIKSRKKKINKFSFSMTAMWLKKHCLHLAVLILDALKSFVYILFVFNGNRKKLQKYAKDDEMYNTK